MNTANFIHYTRIILKCLIEFLPVISFFIAYELTQENFYKATLVMILVTLVYTVYTFQKEKRIPYLALFISFETVLFGTLTLIFRNPMFVQIRDTFYDLVLGSVILISGIIDKPILKMFFGHVFKLENIIWVKLSFSWGLLLLIFGVTNEMVRRSLDEPAWVSYKLFIFLTTVMFGLFLLWKFRKYVKN
jgi:intracellular septation protein